MNSKPILYSTPMVLAQLDGRKNQTRRIIKPQPAYNTPNHSAPYWQLNFKSVGHPFYFSGSADQLKEALVDKDLNVCPYGQVGDMLWVRETHYAYGAWKMEFDEKKGRYAWVFKDFTFGVSPYHYADNPPREVMKKRKEWVFGYYKRPSLFMPKEAARLFNRITDIRVQRLQDISEEDAQAEGCYPRDHRCGEFVVYEAGGYIHDCECSGWPSSPQIMGYKDLWEDINGIGSWSVNPWVWVVSFEVINKPEGWPS